MSSKPSLPTTLLLRMPRLSGGQAARELRRMLITRPPWMELVKGSEAREARP